MNVAVIGGGAAGFFASISVKQHHPNARVVLFEKSTKVLSKVKVSGGGRCNVTHSCFDNNVLANNYPRGGRFLKKAFHQFGVNETIDWFGERNVVLKTEKDNRVFPITDSSQTIVDCLIQEFEKLGCILNTKSASTAIERNKDQFQLTINDQKMLFEKVIVATGGSPKKEGFEWLRKLGHKIELPVPSLFTFNMPKNSVSELMGTVAPEARVRLQGGKLESAGPVLITHWGMSGPAVLKLSAFGARELAERNYHFSILISWLAAHSEEEVRELIKSHSTSNRLAQISNFRNEQIPKRLWMYLITKVGIPLDKRWVDVSKKELNKIVNVLCNDSYDVRGKTTFKEEFVTCGGISLNEVNHQTMESKVVAGLYFSGEVLDIDGVTGGFNFQAAWTTGFIAGKLN